MKSELEKEYINLQELRQNLQNAHCRNEIEEANLEIAKFYKDIASEKGEIYLILFNAFVHSKRAGYEMINIDNVICSCGVQQFVRVLKDAEIEKFTLSTNSSGVIETAWLIEQYGYSLIGIVEVDGCNTGGSFHALYFKLD